MKKFKAEYQNARVTINSPSLGKVVVNTLTADPNAWANIKEFEFMLEDAEVVEVKNTDYNDYTLNELREMFPDIKATSKKAFIEQL